VVSVKGDQVLVASVRFENQAGVVWPHESVVVGGGEDGGHEAAGGVVDGSALVYVEAGAGLDGGGHHAKRCLDQEGRDVGHALGSVAVGPTAD
jgi:hypothetical protein